MKKPELLAPAGNFEKLKVAIHYGADAVYLSGSEYGLRKRAGNFSLSELESAVLYAHEREKKLYVAVNIFPQNKDIQGMSEYLKKIDNIGVDAAIISDPGVVSISKRVAPNLPIHLSTQANTTNWASVKFWEDQGVSRVCLARELPLEEIAEIKEKSNMEIELFIHGAMCISYSGRCLMSKHMANRDANEGDCSQTCRWEFSLMEKKREGEYFPIEEDERGTYFFSSKDLCLIEHIPDLVQSGASSFKIEGRMKSIYYLSIVTKTYREAIDKYCENKKNYKYDSLWKEDLFKTSNRDFTTAFFNGVADNDMAVSSSITQTYDFIGIIKKPLSGNSALVDVRNKIISGDEVEWVGKKSRPSCFKIMNMLDSDGVNGKEVAQPNEEVIMQFNGPVEKYDILRKRKNGCHPDESKNP